MRPFFAGLLILGLVVRASADSISERRKKVSTDQYLGEIESGRLQEWTVILELGQRNDPRILPVLRQLAVRYEVEPRRRFRREKANYDQGTEQFFRDIEGPIEFAAKQAAARLGEKQWFDYFVVGLSTTNGFYRIKCMEALDYIGDRAAIKYLIPIVGDNGTPYKANGDDKPESYGEDAMGVLEHLIPKADMASLPRPYYEGTASAWPSWFKLWWKKNKDKYSKLEFGKEKAFEKSVTP